MNHDKLCLDCIYYHRVFSIDKCRHPAALDRVRGELMRSCEDMRANPSLCGQEGRWFNANITRFTDVGPPKPPSAA